MTPVQYKALQGNAEVMTHGCTEMCILLLLFFLNPRASVKNTRRWSKKLKKL